MTEDDPDEAGTGVGGEVEDGRSFFSMASCARKECGSVRQANAGSTGPSAIFKASTTDVAGADDADVVLSRAGMMLPRADGGGATSGE